ncbi:MAG TPA: hypothetical protein VGH74_03515, partial [Planctomycetaceae bacterium]
MKFFTPELFVQLQASDPDAADLADEAWESALSRYGRRLYRIRLALPRAVRRLAHDLVLQDSDVLSLSRENARFVIVLRLAAPPCRTVILTYRLASDPKIDSAALPPPFCSTRAKWLYDELDVVAGKKQYRHSILLSNG